MASFISNSAEDTWALGHALGARLSPNSVVCLYGDLGAGKTTFIKGLARAVVGGSDEELVVNSPTFTYLNIYHGALTLYHFDLYRLTGCEQFLEMGFDELFSAGGVCCIEWAERIEALDLPEVIPVKFTLMDLSQRLIEIS